jgi:hypothetical protein
MFFGQGRGLPWPQEAVEVLGVANSLIGQKRDVLAIHSAKIRQGDCLNEHSTLANDLKLG